MSLDLVDRIIEMAARQTCNEEGRIDGGSPIITVTEWLRIDTNAMDPIDADLYHCRGRLIPSSSDCKHTFDMSTVSRHFSSPTRHSPTLRSSPISPPPGACWSVPTTKSIRAADSS